MFPDTTKSLLELRTHHTDDAQMKQSDYHKIKYTDVTKQPNA